MFKKPIVKRKEGFSQVCIWPGTVVGPERVDEFEAYMMKEFGVRVQYLEEVITLPDLDDVNDPVPGTGGRNDLLFAVHIEDASKFAIPRLMVGIRWIEDALAQHNRTWVLYDSRLNRYKSWDANISSEQVGAYRAGVLGQFSSPSPTPAPAESDSEGGIPD